MSPPPLTAEARALLETSLSSYEKLEVLRAVRARPAALTRSEIEAATSLDTETVATVLAELVHAGLVTRDAAGRATPGALGRDTACEALMTIYEEDRAAVLSVVSKIAMDRIRNMAARTFADAFVFRKKRGDDG